MKNRLTYEYKVATIYKTRNYDLFERNSKNRNEAKYRSHITTLAESIEKDGMKNPMRVKPDGTILDGHCRFAAAKLVNAAIIYFIEDTKVSVYEAALSHALTKIGQKMTSLKYIVKQSLRTRSCST